jgi:hypothetical protein
MSSGQTDEERLAGGQRPPETHVFETIAGILEFPAGELTGFALRCAPRRE